MDIFSYVSLVMLTALTPGQGIMLTIINSINYGFKKNLNTILGIATAISVLSILTIFALKIIINIVPDFQLYLQFIGGLYISYLGYNLFKNKPEGFENENIKDNKGSFRIYKEAFLISILNPKQIFFLSSVVPLFLIEPNNYYSEISILIIIFIVITLSKHMIYSFFAVKIIQKVKHPDKFIKKINKVIGTIFMLIGITLLIKLFI